MTPPPRATSATVAVNSIADSENTIEKVLEVRRRATNTDCVNRITACPKSAIAAPRSTHMSSGAL